MDYFNKRINFQLCRNYILQDTLSDWFEIVHKQKGFQKNKQTSYQKLLETTIQTYIQDFINHLLSKADCEPIMYSTCDKTIHYLQNKQHLLIYPNSPVWTRDFNSPTINKNIINETLTLTNSSHMIIGHTPQIYPYNGINSIVNNKIIKIDTGMSLAFGNDSHKRIQVLEIMNDKKINVL